MSNDLFSFDFDAVTTNAAAADRREVENAVLHGLATFGARPPSKADQSAYLAPFAGMIAVVEHTGRAGRGPAFFDIVIEREIAPGVVERRGASLKGKTRKGATSARVFQSTNIESVQVAISACDDGSFMLPVFRVENLTASGACEVARVRVSDIFQHQSREDVEETAFSEDRDLREKIAYLAWTRPSSANKEKSLQIFVNWTRASKARIVRTAKIKDWKELFEFLWEEGEAF